MPATEGAERVYGLAAALSVWQRRPEQVISIAHTPEARRALAELLRQAARRRVAYREVSDEELARMADSVHHEGVCMLVKARPTPGPSELAERVGEFGLVLALDGVQNPHNVGAILRSAAYFGVAAMLLSESEHSPLTAAAKRVAEGGAELVAVAQVSSLPAALRSLADRDFVAFGADARAKISLAQLHWPKRAVLALGHEQHGLSPEVRKACKTLVRIAGSEAIDSLNVSVAAGIFMASYANAHGIRT